MTLSPRGSLFSAPRETCGRTDVSLEALNTFGTSTDRFSSSRDNFALGPVILDTRVRLGMFVLHWKGSGFMSIRAFLFAMRSVGERESLLDD